MALGGGEALARLCAFAGTVYLARTLSPSLYGIVGVAMGIMLYLTQIADGGIELVGVPVVARARDRIADVAAPILSARFLLATAVTLVVVLVGVTVLPQPDGVILAVSALSLLAVGLSTRWIHIGQERAGSVAVSRTIGELLALGLLVALVRTPGDIARVPLAQFIGVATTSGILLAILSREGISIPWRWAPGEARDVFARSRMLVGFTLLGLILFNFDLIFLRIRTGADAAGYYSAAYTMIAFAANLIVAFAHTVLPTLTRLEGAREERDALFQGAGAQAFTVALPVGAGAWFVAEPVIREIFGVAYLPGVIALQLLAWSIPLAALRELPVVALIAAGRERDLLRVNAITAAANMALVVAVVPPYGLRGAAAATLATELIRLALASHFARAAGYPMVSVRRLLKATAATGLMVTVLLAAPPLPFWLSAPLGAAVYAAGLALIGGLRLRGGMPVLHV